MESFDRCFVINLEFKTERLERFLENYPKCLPPVEVMRAVHGDTVAHPEWWKSGSGAWGCYRSHMQILERCYNEGIESYCVFEDDCIFRDDFEPRLSDFSKNVPDDWQQLYLGGQLLHEYQHPPRKINEHVYAPYNVNRTHAFAMHQRGYRAMYHHLFMVPFIGIDHIDHAIGRLHEKETLKVYCPAKWLCGQDAGASSISGRINSATYWTDPEKHEQPRYVNQTAIPAVFLQSPLGVAVEMESRGWHRGHWQNESRLDIGVCNALQSLDVRGELEKWYQVVSREAASMNSTCVCLYHPTLHPSLVKDLKFADFQTVIAVTAEDAQIQLECLMAPKEKAA